MNPAEKKVLAALGKDFEDFLLDQSKLILRAVVEIANKSGYDLSKLQYLFYILFERSQDWPSLSKSEFGALKVLTEIVTKAGEIPKYRDGLQVPDFDTEKLIDPILKKLAIWAQMRLTGTVLRGYQALLKKHSRDWFNASEETPEDKMMGVLRLVFEKSLLRLPLYTHAGLMSNVMSFIL